MHDALPCTLLTWKAVYGLCRQLAQQLRADGYRIDLIVAIGRGGYVPGRLLSDMLGIHDLASFKVEHYQGTEKRHEAFIKYPLNASVDGKNVLLLDDVSDTGDTFEVGVRHLRQCGNPNDIRTAALHYKTISHFVPDFFVETLGEWRWLIYPWAANEDLSALLAKMSPATTDIATLQRQIKRRHGIDAANEQIEDALALLGNAEASGSP